MRTRPLLGDGLASGHPIHSAASPSASGSDTDCRPAHPHPAVVVDLAAADLVTTVLGGGDLDDAISRVLRIGTETMGPDVLLSMTLRLIAPPTSQPSSDGDCADPTRHPQQWQPTSTSPVPRSDATDQRARDLQRWQSTHDDGPSHAADQCGRTVVVADCGTDELFERFGHVATEAGIGACASFPMQVARRRLGTITCYLPRGVDIGAALLQRGEQLARAAGPVLFNVHQYEHVTRELAQLSDALRGRTVIERAKGLLMGQHGIDDDQAFDLLSVQSQHENTKLREIAARLLARHASV